MRTHNFKKDIDYRLFYGLVIVMVLLLGIFVEDSLGSGPMCSPCDVYDFDSCLGSSGGWRCMGCDTDYGACYSCDSSGHCADRCNPAIDCKSCTMEVVHMPCGDRMRALGCTHNDCYAEYCQTCIGGVCTACDGNEFKMCCDGTCFDTRIKHCCWDTTGNGYICDSNEDCCYGNCCDRDANECCINGECDTHGEWKNPVSVTFHFDSYVVGKVQSAIDKIFHVEIEDVGATATKNFRDCCLRGTLIENGEQYGEGTGRIQAELMGAALWGGSFEKKVVLGGWSATITCEAGVMINGNFEASGTIGQRFDDCDNKHCYYCSLDASATIGCAVEAEVTGCVETPYTEEKCATASVTPASIDIGFTGTLGCNSAESCNGCFGEVKVKKVEFTASVKCGGVGAEFSYIIYAGDE